MNPRPLDILDLPTLYRYRDEVINLDSTRLLTRGNPLGAAGFLSYFNPSRHLYSAVSSDNNGTLLGGVVQTNGDSFAKLVYLAPESNVQHPLLPGLVDHLGFEAGQWGAFHLLAEVEESHDVFPILRQAGFSVYAWQRLWNVSHVTSSDKLMPWVHVKSENLHAVQSLYHQIVPPLLQPVEPIPKQPKGLICSKGWRCYANIYYGIYGIVIIPLIHPEVTGVEDKFISLLSQIPGRRGRPVYICIRSFQAWLEPVLEDLGGLPARREAIMVKHLARMVKDEQTVRSANPGRVSIQPSRVSRP